MKKLGLLSVVLVIMGNLFLFGQEEKKKTLFDYPVVPDTISTLENRSNYFLSNFWNKADFSKPIKDTLALQEAFNDYVVFFQYAHKNVVLTSINDLMNRAQSNKANFMLMAEVAEKGLYDVDAELWSDDAYIPFVEAVIAHKKVKSQEKERYKIQLQKIKRNKTGEPVHSFDYIDINGDKKNIMKAGGDAEIVILFFNDPECSDCIISRLRLSTNITVNNLLKEGKLKIVSIYPGAYSKEWAEDAKRYSDQWDIGAFEDADEIFDIRMLPNIYILDKNRKILSKNVTVNEIIQQLEN